MHEGYANQLSSPRPFNGYHQRKRNHKTSTWKPSDRHDFNWDEKRGNFKSRQITPSLTFPPEWRHFSTPRTGERLDSISASEPGAGTKLGTMLVGGGVGHLSHSRSLFTAQMGNNFQQRHPCLSTPGEVTKQSNTHTYCVCTYSVSVCRMYVLKTDIHYFKITPLASSFTC